MRVGLLGMTGRVPRSIRNSRSRSLSQADRRRRTVERRTVLPAAPRLEHVNDAADDPAIVLAMRPRLVLRRQRLDRRPLPIVEPEFPRRDPRSADTRRQFGGTANA